MVDFSAAERRKEMEARKAGRGDSPKAGRGDSPNDSGGEKK